jgi:hypothetical protein
LAQQPLTSREVLDIARGALDAHRGQRAAISHSRRHPDKAPAADVAMTTASVARPVARPVAREPSREHGKERDMAGKQRPYTCSFCGKNREQARRLIAGPNGIYICDDCIALCNEILAENEPSAPAEAPAAPSAAAQASAQRGRAAWWRRLLSRDVSRRRQSCHRLAHALIEHSPPQAVGLLPMRLGGLICGYGPCIYNRISV